MKKILLIHEPNGYLHIGHAKAIGLNFGLGEKYGAPVNLRFDDTNPEKEETEYVKAIKEDVKWLGYNWSEETYEGMEEQYPFLKEFDDKIISGREFLIKPDPRIYELAASRFNLLPQETLFIDDIENNIKTAIKLGFQTIHLTDPSSIKLEIKKFMNFKINEIKAKNSVISTSFENLKKIEKKDGFVESIKSKKNNKKIMFFNLGRNNNWKKLLDIKIAKNIEAYFTKEMKELKYL